MSLTSNRILDILILSAIFALLVTVFPVQGYSTYTVDAGTCDVQSDITGIYPSLSGYGNPYSPAYVNISGSFVMHNVTSTLCGGGISLTSCTGTVCDMQVSGSDYTFSIQGDPGYSSVEFSCPCNSATYTYLSMYSDSYVPTPIANFYGDPTSGGSPLTVQFTDVSVQSPTGWSWDFGDGDNTNNSVQNPVHTYGASGVYTVTLTASNSYGSDNETKSAYITVSSSPVASFSCSPTNTTSPASVTCTDSSTGIPTDWLWQLTSYGVSMSPGGSYGAGIYSAVNSSQNPVFYMDGSGMVDVRLTVSNSYGSDEEYKPNYITISGAVPTPTPTPAIPWPNQTGVCIGSSITLGSGQSRGYPEHYQLTNPYGDTYSGQYNIGETNYISGHPFFTALKGQYVYQELNLTGDLHWQQSYVTQYCNITTVPTGTVTTMPTIVPYVTGGPTYNPYPIPTITLTTTNDTININLPWVNLSTIPTALPPLPEYLNETSWRQTACNYGSIGGLLCPLMAIVYAILGTASDIVLMFMSIGFAPLVFVISVFNFVKTLSVTILSSWLGVGSIIVSVIGQLVNALPDKVKNVVTLIMCLDVFKQCYELWDWV